MTSSTISQAHADRDAKEKYLSQLPAFLVANEPKQLETGADNLRVALIRKIQQLSEAQLPAVEEFLKSLKG